MSIKKNTEKEIKIDLKYKKSPSLTVYFMNGASALQSIQGVRSRLVSDEPEQGVRNLCAIVASLSEEHVSLLRTPNRVRDAEMMGVRMLKSHMSRKVGKEMQEAGEEVILARVKGNC